MGIDGASLDAPILKRHAELFALLPTIRKNDRFSVSLALVDVAANNVFVPFPAACKRIDDRVGQIAVCSHPLFVISLVEVRLKGSLCFLKKGPGKKPGGNRFWGRNLKNEAWGKDFVK